GQGFLIFFQQGPKRGCVDLNFAVIRGKLRKICFQDQLKHLSFEDQSILSAGERKAPAVREKILPPGEGDAGIQQLLCSGGQGPEVCRLPCIQIDFKEDRRVDSAGGNGCQRAVGGVERVGEERSVGGSCLHEDLALRQVHRISLGNHRAILRG